MIGTVRNYTYANNPLTNDKFMKYHKIIIKKKKKKHKDYSQAQN